jgi:ABC-type multidrug transport system fused ATPase/permease subunit
LDPDLSSFLQADLEAVVAAIAVLISLVALYYSVSSAKSSHRSASAAEEANQHARRSAGAADLNRQFTREAFENEAKRSKALAYWLLYRIHNLFLARGSLALEELENLSPLQEFLHVYGHTLDPRDRENVRIALNGIELLIAHGGIDDGDKLKKSRHT